MTDALELLKGRDLLEPGFLSGEQVRALLERAAWLKEKFKSREPHRLLEGRSIGLVFEKPSTRTRVSFEVGAAQLGAHPVVLDATTLQLSRGETMQDMGRVLSRYLDALVLRTFSQSRLEELAEGAGVPVINGLSDTYHPCQILGDLLTIQERRGRLAGLKLAYVGDGNNVAQTLLFGAGQVGMDMALATPPGREVGPEILSEARRRFEGAGTRIGVGHDPGEACANADVIYTDVWVSMGDEIPGGPERLFSGYRVNEELLGRARDDCLVMHCLPAHRGQEITDQVIDGPNSAVLDQAENRLHAQKALLVSLITGWRGAEPGGDRD